MTRWTIPTLIDTLYRNGMKLEAATELVSLTYPITRGDEDFKWSASLEPENTIVGPYALFERLRGVYPSDAPTHAGADARTIVAALRNADERYHEVCDCSFGWTPPVLAAAGRAYAYIRAGGQVNATEVDDDYDVAMRVTHILETAREAEGLGESIRSVPLPVFDR